jgi:hypothetical protein
MEVNWLHEIPSMTFLVVTGVWLRVSTISPIFMRRRGNHKNDKPRALVFCNRNSEDCFQVKIAALGSLVTETTLCFVMLPASYGCRHSVGYTDSSRSCSPPSTWACSVQFLHPWTQRQGVDQLWCECLRTFCFENLCVDFQVPRGHCAASVRLETVLPGKEVLFDKDAT